ncbi:MAG TPA: DNA methyltransferase, partial [Dehalococcoidia bacterium]|nr:DNA methyltransferase [Dehalococcoidia bacterium]
KNGIASTEIPILDPLTTIEHMDAVLDESDPANPKEPEWPEADVIVGNPPFLGTKKMRSEIGDEKVRTLRELYKGRVPGFADFCCFWLEKARAQIEQGRTKRAGLLATQAVRGGLNREVLKRIKATGDIFFAESDRPWILNGAAVHVSMVGFDDGSESKKTLNSHRVKSINSNLTSEADLTTARRLAENASIGFIGDVKVGSFDLTPDEASSMLGQGGNPNNRPNSDVIRPWINGMDITRRPRSMWIIDFPPRGSIEEAAQYEAPFEYVTGKVKPLRDGSKRKPYRERWWIHAEPVIAMRDAIAPLRRFLITPILTKHRLFVWREAPTLPDHQLVVFARADDYFFGVLHSSVHEWWARAQGTQLREVESGFRYTPTTCFETFPFPWPPGQEPAGDARVQAIAAGAADLDKLRNNWLNPPEGSLGEDELKLRTLTILYNQRPTWLDNAHRKLDEAVFAAYGWPATLTREEVLERLLALNQARAAAASK